MPAQCQLCDPNVVKSQIFSNVDQLRGSGSSLLFPHKRKAKMPFSPPLSIPRQDVFCSSSIHAAASNSIFAWMQQLLRKETPNIFFLLFAQPSGRDLNTYLKHFLRIFLYFLAWRPCLEAIFGVVIQAIQLAFQFLNVLKPEMSWSRVWRVWRQWWWWLWETLRWPHMKLPRLSMPYIIRHNNSWTYQEFQSLHY